jgi:hypothetical protein
MPIKTEPAVPAGEPMSRFRWTFHNVVAHPLSELLWQLGFVDWSQWVHDSTVPADERA